MADKLAIELVVNQSSLSNVRQAVKRVTEDVAVEVAGNAGAFATVARKMEDSVGEAVKRVAQGLGGGPQGFASSLLSMKSLLAASIAIPLIAGSAQLKATLENLLTSILLVLKPIGDFIGILLRPLVLLLYPLVRLMTNYFQGILGKIAQKQGEAMASGDTLGALGAVVTVPAGDLLSGKTTLQEKTSALFVLIGDAIVASWVGGKLLGITAAIAALGSNVATAIGVEAAVGTGTLGVVSGAIVDLGGAVAATLGTITALVAGAFGVVTTALTGFAATLAASLNVLAATVTPTLVGAGVLTALALFFVTIALWLKGMTDKANAHADAYNARLNSMDLLTPGRVEAPYLLGGPAGPGGSATTTGLGQSDAYRAMVGNNALWAYTGVGNGPQPYQGGSNLVEAMQRQNMNVTINIDNKGAVIDPERFKREVEEAARRGMALNTTYGGGGLGG